MTVRLGTNPIGWSNDDLRELGAATSLETCLAEARQAGFTGIELGHKFPRDAAVLGPVLQRHNLALVSGWHSANLLQRDVASELLAMRPHIGLLRELGCTVLILAETSNAIHGNRFVPPANRPVLSDTEWTRFAGRLTALADAVAEEGLSVAYHHHMGTIVQTEADIDRLMVSTGPALKLLLDTGHAVFAGADPVALARRHRERIAHVHCKDVRGPMLDAARVTSFLDAVVAGVFTVPGDGMVDFPGVLAELSGYDGWLVVEAEQDPVVAPAYRYAERGYRHLSELVTGLAGAAQRSGR
jgi:inosose dehydratase